MPGLLAQGRAGHGDAAPTPSACDLSRRMVLELLASSVDLSTAPARGVRSRYEADPSASARRRRPSGRARSGEPATTPSPTARRPRRCSPVKVDNDLYVRDYRSASSATSASRPAATDAQNTFAIAVAGRGFDARISTEFDVAAARLRVRLLRQLHRRLPDRRADVPAPSTSCARRAPGTRRPDRHRHDLPLLRRRLHLDLHVQDNRDRQGDLARTTTTSRAATSASRAASASSTCRCATSDPRLSYDFRWDGGRDAHRGVGAAAWLCSRARPPRLTTRTPCTTARGLRARPRRRRDSRRSAARPCIAAGCPANGIASGPPALTFTTLEAMGLYYRVPPSTRLVGYTLYRTVGLNNYFNWSLIEGDSSNVSTAARRETLLDDGQHQPVLRPRRRAGLRCFGVGASGIDTAGLSLWIDCNPGEPPCGPDGAGHPRVVVHRLDAVLADRRPPSSPARRRATCSTRSAR